MVRSSRSGEGWRLRTAVVGVGFFVVALAGCTDSTNGPFAEDSEPRTDATFSDGSLMPDDLLAIGDACHQLYPLDDDAFLECVLRAGGTSGSASQLSTATESTTSSTSVSRTTTSTIQLTTTTLVPDRLVAVSVLACPDFVEATFRNAGRRSVRIAEIGLFLDIGGEAIDYVWDWTEAVDAGASATWRVGAADLGLEWIPSGSVSVGARLQTSRDFVYSDGPNPHESCTATAPPTTTFAQAPYVDVTGSVARCTADGATFTFRITNTGTTKLTLHQVALFPYENDSHHFDDVDSWWPLPDVEPGETATHSDEFFFGESWGGDSIELLVSSSNGQTIVDIACS